MAEFEVIFADVGQGDCTLLRMPNGEYMLVDVYRCPGNGIDVFKLLDEVLPDGSGGRKRLDYLVITHAHDDHITGIGDLYERYEVENLWVPQHEDRKQVAKHFDEYQKVVDKHPAERLYRPQGSRTPLDVDLGEHLVVRCFSPPGYIEIGAGLTDEEAKKVIHANCLVLRVCYQEASVVLTGDSDIVCWKRVIDYYKGRTAEETGTEVLDATVLHASHHGSRTFFKDGGEDAEPWLEGLETIDPEAVIVSVGEGNRHKHPHEDMMAAYRDHVGDENVYETREVGSVVFSVEADGGYEIAPAEARFAPFKWDDDDDGGGGPEEGGTDPGGGPSRTLPHPVRRPKPKPDRGRRYG